MISISILEITAILQTAIFFITLVVGAFYAWSTWGLWKSSIEQSKQNLMPLTVIYARSGIGSSRGRVFRIRNIGYGSALNIEIEEFVLHIKDNINGHKINNKYKYILKMSDPNILVKDEEKDLVSETYLNGELLQGDDLLFPYLNPQYATRNTPLTISYQDVRGHRYSMQIAFGTGKLNIIKLPTEVTL